MRQVPSPHQYWICSTMFTPKVMFVFFMGNTYANDGKPHQRMRFRWQEALPLWDELWRPLPLAQWSRTFWWTFLLTMVFHHWHVSRTLPLWKNRLAIAVLNTPNLTITLSLSRLSCIWGGDCERQLCCMRSYFHWQQRFQHDHQSRAWNLQWMSICQVHGAWLSMLRSYSTSLENIECDRSEQDFQSHGATTWPIDHPRILCKALVGTWCYPWGGGKGHYRSQWALQPRWPVLGEREDTLRRNIGGMVVRVPLTTWK